MEDHINRLTKTIVAFRDARDWKQFHTPKDTALALVLEAAEVMEPFRFKNDQEVEKYLQLHKGDVAEELADVFFWTLLMCHDLGIDLADALDQKMAKNAKRYPVEKAKGSSAKYTEL